VNRKNTKTNGKHREVAEKPLHKCTNEELMHGIAEPPAKVHKIREISFDWSDPTFAKFRCAPTKSVPDIRWEKNLVPGKVGQNSP